MLVLKNNHVLRKEDNPLVNTELLRAEIEDLGIKQNTIALKCHVSRQTVNKWLSNPGKISVDQAKSLADALRITDPDKFMAIFFAPNVENNSTDS